MKLFILVAFGALALGSYFYEDIDLYFTNEFGGTQDNISIGGSVGNVGDSLNSNMRNIGDSIGR